MPSADQLREHLVSTVSPRAHVIRERGRVVVLLEDQPFVSEGTTIEGAAADLVLTLREYAHDWDTHLHCAPNHASNWPLVQLVQLSSDVQLLEWLRNGRE